MLPDGKRPQAVRYHGLRNQGATCYLNSVLQVLFMTKDYRDAVKRHSSENSDTEFIDHHLSTLFDDLQEGTSDTKEITCKLGIDRVYEQRDAAEYFEKILNLTSPEASQIFHGQLTHKTICSSCGTETDSDEAFWHLPLALVDPNSESYSVENGIKEYFKDADFRGENQMYCDLCDDKSDATIKCVVKHHPEVLMLLLKRFEFNFTYMTHIKNNCAVEVPYTLKISQNQMYELYAVVEHLGDLRRGHHMATIKSQDDGAWHIFSDTEVSLNYQPFKSNRPETSHSAYLLFYRKIKVHADDTCNPNMTEMSSPKDLQSAVRCSDIGLNRNEKLDGSREVKQHHNIQSVSVNKQRDRKRTKEVDKIRKNRGDDLDRQRKGPSESRHDCDQDGNQSNMILGDTAQNKPEGKLSSTHSGHEKASMMKQTKVQQNEKDKDAQSEADSPHRQEGSAGSRGCAEIQEAGSVVRRRREDSRPKETFSEDRVGEISGLKKTYIVGTIEEETRQTPSGPQIHTETDYKILKKVKYERKSKCIRGKSDPKKNLEDSLTEPFNNLSLSDSDSEQKKSLSHKSARKRRRELNI